MLRLFLRKLGFILISIPILHWVGVQYARLHPRFNRPGFRGSLPDPELTYRAYFDQALAGDFGRIGTVSIPDLLGNPILNSLRLVGLAVLLTIVVGMLIGFLSISIKTGRVRPWSLILTTAGSSIPGFLLGGVVITIIVYQTLYGGLKKTPLPISGYGLDLHLVLPLLVLATRPALHLAKVIAGLLEHELQKDYIRTARGKGARWGRVLRVHALRNIIAPIIVVVGQSMRLIVGGLLVVEMMFSWPGIGRFFVYAIVANENLRGQAQYFANPYLIAALSVIMGVLLLTADLIASLATQAADPRLRQARG